MDLIDAKAWKLDLLLLHGSNEKTAWIIDRINHAPTVDAIPISWIEQYVEENWFDYGTQYNAITEMLKAWERENNEG